MPLPLNHREFGEKDAPPLIVLHGLLGSSRNWITAGRDLSARWRVYAPDLRNHGESPHNDQMNYTVMAEDVRAWIAGLGLSQVDVLGHSMGGKVAMLLACQSPQLVNRLIVEDIAPKAYKPHHRAEFNAMLELPVGEISSRRDAEVFFEKRVLDRQMRQFLLSNLVRSDKGFRWQINLPVLNAALGVIVENSLAPEERFDGPALFIRGGRSDYVLEGDCPKIEAHFPRYEMTTLGHVGHNIHFEDREAFVREVTVWADNHPDKI